MRVLALFTCVLVLALLSAPALAQDPTATPWPTLIPLSPTPTSKYEGFRITPTPWSVEPDPNLVADFNTDETAGQIADTIINSYKALNVGGVLDFASFIAMVLIVIMFLIRIQSRGTRHHD